MLIICLWHYSDARVFIKHGYIGVEFYFILAGVFLYMTTMKEDYPSPLDYAIKRYRRFNPKYVASIMITYMYLYLPDIVKGTGSFWSDHRYMGIAPDLMMLQSIGVFDGLGGVNKPLWYMSVLFVGGTIVYSIIYCTKKIAINLLIPMIFILGYTYLFHNSTSNTIESWDIDGCISNPLIRGISDISLGTLIGYFICEKKESICKHSFSISVCSIVSFLVAVCLCFYEYPFDNISLIAFSLLIIGCFSEHSLLYRLFSGRIWNHLGALSYSMLLLHYPVMLMTNRVCHIIEIHDNFRIVIYMCNVLICSLLFDWIFKNRIMLLSFKNRNVKIYNL